MLAGGGPMGICGRGAMGGLIMVLFAWLPGRPPSLDVSEDVRDAEVMILTEGGAGEEVVLLLLGGGEVMVGEL